jgi:hypothetical protein
MHKLAMHKARAHGPGLVLGSLPDGVVTKVYVRRKAPAQAAVLNSLEAFALIGSTVSLATLWPSSPSSLV